MPNTNSTKSPPKDAVDRAYIPTKADMEKDISVPATPERLVEAALKGGADRRK